MAQQQPFSLNSQDDERRREPRPETVTPGRYSEQRTANFAGGSIDPETGNLTSTRPVRVERGDMPEPGDGGGESRLSRVEAPPPPPRMSAPPPPPPQQSSGGGILNTIATVALVGAAFFCYGRGTLVMLADTSMKPIEEVVLGDNLMLGGRVTARGEALMTEDMFTYRGVVVSGSHAVFEDGRFLRVRDSDLAQPIEVPPQGIVVYPLVTERHLMMLDSHIAADFNETDDGSEVPASERLETMNADIERNRFLADIEAATWPDRDRALSDREPLSAA